MITTIKIVKNGFIYSFISGFCVGCCFPNKVFISYNGEKSRLIENPILFGVISSTGLFCSPLLFINYFCNCTYIDKWVDKYDISINRIHQCRPDKDYLFMNNMYAFPSSIHIDIKNKK